MNSSRPVIAEVTRPVVADGSSVPQRSDAGLTRNRALGLIQGLLADGIVSPLDLRAFAPDEVDKSDPEVVRQDYEAWFKALGIETVTGRPFTLSECPYTRAELSQAAVDGWIPVVSPKGLTMGELAETFHYESWATSDPLVSSPPEEEDLWFLTPASLVPEYSNCSAKEARQRNESGEMLGLSLQRYMILSARLRHLTGEQPDFRWWVWMLRGRYDRSGFLIAGFDPNNRFSVHAWMPGFRASFVGSRSITVCPRIAGPTPRGDG